MAGKAGKAMSAMGEASKLASLGKVTTKSGDLTQQLAELGKIKIKKLELNLAELGSKAKYAAANTGMGALEKAVPPFNAARETMRRFGQELDAMNQRAFAHVRDLLDQLGLGPGPTRVSVAGGHPGTHLSLKASTAEHFLPDSRGGSSHGSPDLTGSGVASQAQRSAGVELDREPTRTHSIPDPGRDIGSQQG